MFEIGPVDGHLACQLEETETAIRRRFLWQIFGQSST